MSKGAGTIERRIADLFAATRAFAESVAATCVGFDLRSINQKTMNAGTAGQYSMGDDQ